MVHRIFEGLHLVRSVDRYAYMGTGTGITFDTNSWAALCFHETMAKLLKYKFDDHTAISLAITQCIVCKSTSNTMLKPNVYLDNINSLLDQVKLLLIDLTKFKSNQNSTYDTLHNPKDKGS